MQGFMKRYDTIDELDETSLRFWACIASGAEPGMTPGVVKWPDGTVYDVMSEKAPHEIWSFGYRLKNRNGLFNVDMHMPTGTMTFIIRHNKSANEWEACSETSVIATGGFYSSLYRALIINQIGDEVPIQRYHLSIPEQDIMHGALLNSSTLISSGIPASNGH